MDEDVTPIPLDEPKPLHPPDSQVFSFAANYASFRAEVCGTLGFRSQKITVCGTVHGKRTARKIAGHCLSPDFKQPRPRRANWKQMFCWWNPLSAFHILITPRESHALESELSQKLQSAIHCSSLADALGFVLNASSS